MTILTIRTDKPEAEVGLFNDQEQKDYELWQADKELSLTILGKINDLLEKNQKTLHDVEAILAYKGPGSFTGLRIGISVANALSYGLKIPVIGSDKEDWIADGINKLLAGENDTITLPDYGQEPNITKPIK